MRFLNRALYKGKIEIMQKDLLRLMRDPSLLSSEKQTLLSNIAAQAAEMNLPCYLVGGFVRDLVLGQSVNDFDVVVEGDAIKFGEALVKKHGGHLTSHQKFHTAIWHLPQTWNLLPNTLDLITARKETYISSGALPSVVPSTIEDDLQRRDFTINAMAIRIDGSELLDPLHGQADLEKKIIRVLHPRSFVDDPTRMFRAIRYEGRYGFKFEPDTLKLINAESLLVIMKLSGERIRHELDLIFEEENSAPMIERAGILELLKSIHPKLPMFNPEYSELLNTDPILDIPMDRASVGYMLWFIDLLEEEILSISERLDFSSDLSHAVWAVSQLKRSLPFLVGAKPSEWFSALEKLPLPSIYVVFLVSGEKALLDYLSIWRHVKPKTTGDDLKARGLQPGPRFGEILDQLRAAWLDGEVQSYEEELRMLDGWLK
jgi:tRNA nucleotidyltransferase (CCA-adding enzyme)